MVLDSCPDFCSTRLSLGLAFICSTRNDPPKHDDDHVKASLPKSFPSDLKLGLPSDDQQKTLKMDITPKAVLDRHHQQSSVTDFVHGSGQQQASSGSTAVSSFSNSSVKREIREVSGDDYQDLEEERHSAKTNVVVDQEQDEEGPRKKLRLTKEQAFVLEESFKEHSTLNPKQKQVLADKLSLRPRQVEVWFQNRRARTKLKQTEVDFEVLKKCCETLKEENKRLHKELQELKAMIPAAPPTPFYMQLPAATLTMFPSCETISAPATTGGGASGGSGETSSRMSFSIGGKSHFYHPFANHPSAAC